MGKGGGGGGQTTSTTNTSNIPEYARPYVETMLGATQQQLFTGNTDAEGNYNITGFQPYKAYGATYDEQGNQTSYDPSKAVAGFSPLQQQAQQGIANLQNPDAYGQATGMSGMGAVNAARLGQQANPMDYQQQMAGYMNPYMQQVLAPQMAELQRQYGISGAQQASNATAAGAFGGSRDAIMAAENQRNLMNAQNQAVGQAYNNAFNQAQNQYNQSGAFQLQANQAAMQNAAQMANIAGQGLQSQEGIYGVQNQAGAAQQAQQQQIINQSMQDYANAQQYPLMQLGTMSNMLRGLPMQASTTNQYAAAPNAVTQGIGAAGALGSLAKATAASGGLPKEFKMKRMASGGITSIPSYSVGGSIKSELEMMPIDELQKQATQSSSGEIRAMAKAILQEKLAGQAEEQKIGNVGPVGPMGVQYEAPPVRAARGGIMHFVEGDKGKLEAGQDPDIQALQSAYVGASQSGDKKAADVYRAKMENAVTNFQAREAAAAGASDPTNYSNEGRNPLPERELETSDAGAMRAPPKTGIGPVLRNAGTAIANGIRGVVERPTPASFAPKGSDDEYIPVGYEKQRAAAPVQPRLLNAADVANRTPAEQKEQGRLAGILAAQQMGDFNRVNAATGKGGPVPAPAPTQGGPAPAAAPAADRYVAQAQKAGVTGDQAQQEYAARAEATEKSVSDYLKERQDALRAAGVEPDNKGMQDYRAQLMSERANAKDEAQRQRYMRMAEFFSRWGSTPGSTLAAGLSAMQKSIPDFIADQKEQKKANRELDKAMYDIDQAIRLEKIGDVDAATKLKEKAADRTMELQKAHITGQYHIEANKVTAGAHVEAARMRESGEDRRATRNETRDAETTRWHADESLRKARSTLATFDKNLAAEKKIGSEYANQLAMSQSKAPGAAAAKQWVKDKDEEFVARRKELTDDIAFYESRRKAADAVISKNGSAPAFNPSKLSGEDKSAWAWAEAHPDDPRAAKIKARVKGE